jgi:hypothetical protein
MSLNWLKSKIIPQNDIPKSDVSSSVPKTGDRKDDVDSMIETWDPPNAKYQTTSQINHLRAKRREYQRILRYQARSWREYQEPISESAYKIWLYFKESQNSKALNSLSIINDPVDALIQGVGLLLDSKTELQLTDPVVSFDFNEAGTVEFTAKEVKDIIKEAGQFVYILLKFLVQNRMLEMSDESFKNMVEAGPVELISRARKLFEDVDIKDL